MLTFAPNDSTDMCVNISSFNVFELFFVSVNPSFPLLFLEFLFLILQNQKFLMLMVTGIMLSSIIINVKNPNFGLIIRIQELWKNRESSRLTLHKPILSQYLPLNKVTDGFS